MRILLATSQAIPSGGGIASYNQELVNLFSKEHRINLLTDADEQEVEGYSECISNFGHVNRDASYCNALVESINTAGYDCIINSNSAFIPVIAPFLSAPIVSVSHFVNGRLAINAGYNSQYLNGIVALSHYGKDFLCKRFQIVDSDKIKVVYNFVKSDSRYFNRGKVCSRPLTIVYPGGTAIAKSVDVVVHTVYKLLKSDLDFRFYWLGGTELPCSRHLFGKVKSLNDLFQSDHRLIITGLLPRTEAMKMIANANIFLLPSRGEGCPMTLLEAMRGGCIPVVSDAHHGSREILEKAGVGIIVKQDSAKDLFDSVSDILKSHDKYESDYKDTIDYLHKYLSEEKWGNEMTEIINSAVLCSRLTIPFDYTAFIESSKGYTNLLRRERIKTKLSSLLYRMKIECLYFRNKCGLV